MALKKFKILIIDNDLNTVMALEEQLQATNREIFRAYSAAEGLQIIEKEAIGLVIADQIMPNMDGLELIEMLESNPKTRNIFTILITRLDDQFDENIVQSLSSGAVDYLIKPVKPHVSRAKVKVFERLFYKRMHLENRNNKIQELLLNILPKSTADELRIRGKSRVRSYDSATIMFTDFVDFTQRARFMEPQTLVKRLDEYFVAFDKIIGEYPIEKIKTIGDAYMCASGIPIRNRSHAIDMTLAALSIREFMYQDHLIRETNGEDPWPVRIGMHSGPLVAGVVGMKKWSYDIWGHSVNTASRLENTAEPGTINISHDTYELIAEWFDCEHRGKVNAKHIGDIDMYNVIGLKEAYRNQEAIYLPNARFIEQVSQL